MEQRPSATLLLANHESSRHDELFEFVDEAAPEKPTSSNDEDCRRESYLIVRDNWQLVPSWVSGVRKPTGFSLPTLLNPFSRLSWRRTSRFERWLLHMKRNR